MSDHRVAHRELARAVMFSYLPGVNRAEACDRFMISRRTLTEARRDHSNPRPSRLDLVLATLTKNGTLCEGTLPDLVGVAAFVDWQNHDGTSAEEIPGLLNSLAERGILELDGTRWRLIAVWP